MLSWGWSIEDPETSIPAFNEHFAALLTKLTDEKRPCFILGDYNIDLLNTNSCNQIFLNTLLSNGFYPSIDRPTREDGATLIDNIFINVHNNQIKSGVWLADITDHLPIFITLPYEHRSAKRNTEYISRRLYSDANINNFKDELTNTDWTPVHQEDGTENKFQKFENIIAKMHNNHFPLVKIKVKSENKDKPWLSSSILNSVKKKNSLYKNYIKSKSPDVKIKYLKYKNKLVSVIRHAEKKYYADKLLNVKDNISKTWRIMNEMCGRKTTHNCIKEIKVNDLIINDPQEIANRFDDFFVNVGPTLAKSIPISCKQPVDFLKGSFLNSMYLAPTNEYEIFDIISNLKNTNSRGFDDIPLCLVKACNNGLCSILAYLNNQSFIDGTFPSTLKIAKVIPVYKSDNVNCVSNYRPISVLSIFLKSVRKAGLF